MLEASLDQSRRTDSSWCTCGHFTIANHSCPRSLFCCVEAKLANTDRGRKIKEKCDDIGCITEHPEFRTLALDKTVGNCVTVYVAL